MKKLNEKKFTSKERKKDAKSGKALSDGSFPIENEKDLKNAIKLSGLAKNKEKAKNHIKKRAKALGKEKDLPKTWENRNLLSFEQFNESTYSANYDEDYNSDFCEEFGLEVGDKFKYHLDIKSNYIDKEKSTKVAYYKGNSYDYIYFSYSLDGIVYKMTKDEMKENFIEKI